MSRKPYLVFALLLLGALAFVLLSRSQPMTTEASAQEPSRLAVLWTSGDPDVAHKMAFMYTLNAKRQGWFDEVTLIVWGPSSKLLSENVELQEAVKDMADQGVEIVACKACSDGYGVSEILEGIGVDVKYMGVPLTEMLKGDWEVLSL
jgi:hypothetical protein